MVFVNDRENLRVVDEDRGAVLYPKGTNREGYSSFELHWRGEVIKFVAVKQINFDNEKKPQTVNWTVDSIEVPDSVFPYNEDGGLKKIIVEALDVYGILFGRKEAREVNIAISPKISGL